jgi:hypothetical protein
MRDLSKQFSDRILRAILKQLGDAFHDYHNGYSQNQRFENEYCDIVDDVVKYFGVNDLDWEEYGFFFKLIELNPDYENDDIGIKLPKLGLYDVFYDVEERQWIASTYRHRIYSYDQGMISDQLHNDENFDVFDGREVNTEVRDSERTDQTLVEIIKVEM